MFKRVLIAEDHELANLSIQRTLEDLGIAHDSRNYVFYCDHAVMRIKKAISEGNPYELLITDLSFEDDIPEQQITTGADLITAVREIQPDLKVLVFSIENRLFIAEKLLVELDIDAYVPKARQDAKDLRLAMEAIYSDKKYLSPNLKKAFKETADYKFTALEKTIVSLISKGKSQKEIASFLKDNQMLPSSLSSVEKSINHLKTTLNISSTGQLIAYCKDNKVI